jgi:hypothetical protein
MSVTADGVIGAPVNQADVQSALGISSSVNKWSQLMPHANVNMWSAYKPLYATKKTRLTDEERANGAHTVEGYTMSYGIKKRKSSVWSDFINTLTGAVISAPWLYDKPVVDGQCGLRITDYIGYHHNAVRIVNVSWSSQVMYLPTNASQDGVTLRFTLTGDVSWTADGDMRWQELFGDCMGYWPTIIMTCFSANQIWQYTKSADKTITQLKAAGNTGVDIYVYTKTLAAAMVNAGATYEYGCLGNNANWICTMVLCEQQIEGNVTAHTVPSGKNIIRLEYASGADRTTKESKLIKYSYFGSMKLTVTLSKVSNNVYNLTSMVLSGEKIRTGTPTANASGTLTCRIGVMRIQGYADAQSVTANPFGSITFDNEIGSFSKAVQNVPSTQYRAQMVDTDGQMHATGNIDFDFGGSIGSFRGAWDIDIKTGAQTFTKEIVIF